MSSVSDEEPRISRATTRPCSRRTPGDINPGNAIQVKIAFDVPPAAVKSTVPQAMWGEIIEKLDEAERHSEALVVCTDSFDDDDDEPYDPTEFIDEADEF